MQTRAQRDPTGPNRTCDRTWRAPTQDPPGPDLGLSGTRNLNSPGPRDPARRFEPNPSNLNFTIFFSLYIQILSLKTSHDTENITQFWSIRFVADPAGPGGTRRDFPGPVRTLEDRSFLDPTGSGGTLWDPLGPSGTLRDPSAGPSGAQDPMRDPSRTRGPKTFRGHSAAGLGVPQSPPLPPLGAVRCENSLARAHACAYASGVVYIFIYLVLQSQRKPRQQQSTATALEMNI